MNRVAKTADAAAGELPYAAYCGPGAYAVVVGVSPEAAVAALRAVRSALGCEVPEPYTSTLVLGAALIGAGFPLERWSTDPRGWRTGPVRIPTRLEREECRRAFDELVELNAPPAPRADPLPSRRRAIDRALFAEWCISSTRRDAHRTRSLNVGEWTRRFPVGTWVLNTASHVLVARAGVLVAGEDEGRSEFSPLVAAWRVLKRA